MSYHLKMSTFYILVKIFKGTYSVGISFTFVCLFLFQLFINQITKIILLDTLVHPSNKPVDLVFPVASISTFYKMGGLFLHSTSWRRQFKGPQEVVCFFETFSNGIDLMNQILHADDSIFPKRSSNQCVVCQGNSLLVDFAITTLVDQFIYELQIWIRRRQWHPTPVLLPGTSHGQRSLVGCSPWGR